jgi:hypothetical protein
MFAFMVKVWCDGLFLAGSVINHLDSNVAATYAEEIGSS